MRLYKDANLPLNEAGSSLSLGHVERHLAHLDRAQEAYQNAWNFEVSQVNVKGQGNVALGLGHIEMQRGKTELAIEHYERAVSFFVNANDIINEADARRSVADLQRLARHFNEATIEYQRVLEVYRANRDNFGVVNSLLGLGRIYLDQRQFDKAPAAFPEAATLSPSIEYELGEADSNLGL